MDFECLSDLSVDTQLKVLLSALETATTDTFKERQIFNETSSHNALIFLQEHENDAIIIKNKIEQLFIKLKMDNEKSINLSHEEKMAIAKEMIEEAPKDVLLSLALVCICGECVKMNANECSSKTTANIDGQEYEFKSVYTQKKVKSLKIK